MSDVDKATDNVVRLRRKLAKTRKALDKAYQVLGKALKADVEDEAPKGVDIKIEPFCQSADFARSRE